MSKNVSAFILHLGMSNISMPGFNIPKIFGEIIIEYVNKNDSELDVYISGFKCPTLKSGEEEPPEDVYELLLKGFEDYYINQIKDVNGQSCMFLGYAKPNEELYKMVEDFLNKTNTLGNYREVEDKLIHTSPSMLIRNKEIHVLRNFPLMEILKENLSNFSIIEYDNELPNV